MSENSNLPARHGDSLSGAQETQGQEDPVTLESWKNNYLRHFFFSKDVSRSFVVQPEIQEEEFPMPRVCCPRCKGPGDPLL